MSRRKNRERAEKGLLFREGRLVPRDLVEGPAREQRVAAVRLRLMQNHNLTIIGGRIYARRKPEPGQSDAGVDLGEEG